MPPNPTSWWTRTIKGKPSKLLLHADRNGFFYVLDRTTAKCCWRSRSSAVSIGRRASGRMAGLS